MAVENIELVDRDYKNCSKKAMPRQIKTRRTSFANIVERFRKFRIGMLERKMERIVDKTLSKDFKEKNISKKLMASSTKLAKIEAKIRVLSREEVPSKFVKSRAIKLRDYMMENTARTADGLYYVDLDDDDVLNFAINGEAGLNNPVNVDVADAPQEDSDDEKIDLSSETIDRDSLTDSINNGFNSLENSPELGKDAIDKDSLTNSINSELNGLDNGDELEEDAINSDSISGVVNNSLDDVQDNKSVDSVVTPEVSDNTDNSAVKETVDDSNSESIDVVIPEINTTDSGNDTIIIDDINKESVENVINGALSDIKDTPVEDNTDEATTFVSPEEVSKVVNSSNEDDDAAVKEVKVADDSDLVTDNSVEFVPDTSEKVSSDQIKGYMDKAFERVTNSEASAVRADRFDENGDIRFKYHYTPMSDEEIEESRRKLNSLKDYKPPRTDIVDISDIFVPVDTSISIEPIKEEKREVPLVVEPRSSEVDIKDEITDYTFDTEETKVEDSSVISEDDAVIDAGSRQAKISEYSRLKERILELRERRNSVDKDRMEAQTSAKQIALKAEETKEKVAQSEAVLEDKVKQMEIYCAGLEKDCEETEKETNKLQDDIKNNTTFIEAQEEQFDKNTRLIDEIDQLIGAEASDENTHSRGK